MASSMSWFFWFLLTCMWTCGNAYDYSDDVHNNSVLLLQLSNTLSVEPLMSMSESFGYISENNAKWEVRRQIHAAEMAIEANNSDAWTSLVTPSRQEGATWWQAHYQPSFHCEFAERFGSFGEGGKWVCNPRSLAQAVESGKSCLVYSIGSNGQFGFEEAVLKEISPACEVHVFDPAPANHISMKYSASRDTMPPQVFYHQIALGRDGSEFQGAPVKSLSAIVKDLGHVGRTIDILKIDCEGCERDMYDDWQRAPVHIQQLLLEIHWPAVRSGVNQQNDDTFTKRANRMRHLHESLLHAGFVAFSKEPNTYGCGGNCVEYSFLHLSTNFSLPRIIPSA